MPTQIEIYRLLMIWIWRRYLLLGVSIDTGSINEDRNRTEFSSGVPKFDFDDILKEWANDTATAKLVHIKQFTKAQTFVRDKMFTARRSDSKVWSDFSWLSGSGPSARAYLKVKKGAAE